MGKESKGNFESKNIFLTSLVGRFVESLLNVSFLSLFKPTPSGHMNNSAQC